MADMAAKPLAAAAVKIADRHEKLSVCRGLPVELRVFCLKIIVGLGEQLSRFVVDLKDAVERQAAPARLDFKEVVLVVLCLE